MRPPWGSWCNSCIAVAPEAAISAIGFERGATEQCCSRLIYSNELISALGDTDADISEPDCELRCAYISHALRTRFNNDEPRYTPACFDYSSAVELAPDGEP